MTEITERMRSLGLTPELLKQWQQEEVTIPEPSWYATPRDRQGLEPHKTQAEVAAQNGHAKEPAVQKPEMRRLEAVAK